MDSLNLHVCMPNVENNRKKSRKKQMHVVVVVPEDAGLRNIVRNIVIMPGNGILRITST